MYIPIGLQKCSICGGSGYKTKNKKTFTSYDLSKIKIKKCKSCKGSGLEKKNNV